MCAYPVTYSRARSGATIRSIDEKIMQQSTQIKLLKTAMITGITLILLGHVVLIVTFGNDNIDFRGYILGAAMNAVGIILSLPTKIYLTLLLMEREERDNKNTHWQDRIK